MLLMTRNLADFACLSEHFQLTRNRLLQQPESQNVKARESRAQKVAGMWRKCRPFDPEKVPDTHVLATFRLFGKGRWPGWSCPAWAPRSTAPVRCDPRVLATPGFFLAQIRPMLAARLIVGKCALGLDVAETMLRFAPTADGHSAVLQL